MKPPVNVILHLDPRKLPEEVFTRLNARTARWKDRAEREQAAWENFGKSGRDPGRLGVTLTAIAEQGKWTPHLKVAQLRTHWDQVVGPGIAAHSQVADLKDGVLVIHTESGAWATQLTYMIPTLTATIRERLKGLDVREVKVTGPQSARFASRYRHRSRNN